MSRFLTTTQFWTLNCVVVLALILILTNISMFLSNRVAQVEINTRQQFVEESVRLNKVSNQLIQSLANLAAQTNDKEIAGLLSAHGIKFTIKTAVVADEVLSPKQGDVKVKSGKKKK